MKEMLFQIGLWAYPGLSILYAFWAMLNFGAKNTMSIETRSLQTFPDWLSSLHFLTQSVAFYLLYFATKDLPIDTNAFSFVIRMWWALSFVTALLITIWHFGTLALRQWRNSKL